LIGMSDAKKLSALIEPELEIWKTCSRHFRAWFTFYFAFQIEISCVFVNQINLIVRTKSLECGQRADYVTLSSLSRFYYQ
jgi:hypothetical protein